MRPALAVAVVVLLAASGASNSQPVDGGGRAPVVDVPNKPAAEQGGDVPAPETIDYVREVAKQGALALLVIGILWSYRRDFFRKLEEKERELEQRKEEREQLTDVIEKSTAAITNGAVTTARQTDATHRLARAVENIERRQAGLPPTSRTPV